MPSMDDLDQEFRARWGLPTRRPKQVQAHKHEFSCTCCYGATCALHDEGIKHCVICQQIITDDLAGRAPEYLFEREKEII